MIRLFFEFIIDIVVLYTLLIIGIIISAFGFIFYPIKRIRRFVSRQLYRLLNIMRIFESDKI